MQNVDDRFWRVVSCGGQARPSVTLVTYKVNVQAQLNMGLGETDACVVVAGWFHSTGYRVEVEERARALGIADRVIWLARISDADIARLLRAAVWGKLPGHGINEPDFLRPARSMSMIGG